jgi:hypothetical protein
MTKVINKIDEYDKQLVNAMDRALNRMALDIHRLSNLTVPVKTGALKTWSWNRRIGRLKWRVQYDMEYALVQETAPGGWRYTKTGSGPHFLGNSLDVISKDKEAYLKREINDIKVM